MSQTPATSSESDFEPSGQKRAVPLVRLLTTPLVDLLRSWSRRSEESHLMAMAATVGLIMGLATAAFRWFLLFSHTTFHGETSPLGVHEAELGWGALGIEMFLPALGGLIVGLLIYRILQLRGGHGVPSVMKAVATGKVNLPPSMAIKSATSPITIASGGSAGPEGPIIEIGAVVGSTVGNVSHTRRDHLGTLVGCGSAAGIAAVFNAPMGGVVFALELIMRDFHVRKFAPVVVAAVIASVTSSAVLPNDPAFVRLPEDMLKGIRPSSLLVGQFALLGVICAATGALLTGMLYQLHDLFHAIKIPMWIKPAIGGLLVGIIGLFAPGVLGEGYETVNQFILQAPQEEAVFGEMILMLMFLGLLKILATSLTLGSGGTGGTFAPAMVAGAMTGAAVGLVAGAMMPNSAPPFEIFALVGMAGVVSSAIGTPLAAMLIIYEVAGGRYELVLPLMITVAISSLLARQLRKGSVYTLSLLRDGFDVEVEQKAVADPLAGLPVSEIMSRAFVKLRPEDPLPRILELLADTDADAFAVVSEKNELRGIISTNDLRAVVSIGEIGETAFIAQDIADTNAPTLTPETSASRALEIFGTSDVEGIAVVDKPESRRIVGIVYRGTVLRAYRRSAGKTS